MARLTPVLLKLYQGDVRISTVTPEGEVFVGDVVSNSKLFALYRDDFRLGRRRFVVFSCR